MGRVLGGNINVDFAVGLFLFLLAFTSVFAYLNSVSATKVSSEGLETSHLEAKLAFENLPWVDFEKSLVYVSGHSSLEFVNLSGYDVDLVVDSEGDALCYDSELGGFVANITGTEVFWVYSTGEFFHKNPCELGEYSDRLDERITSPIYERLLIGKPDNESAGDYCEKFPINYLTDDALIYGCVLLCV